MKNMNINVKSLFIKVLLPIVGIAATIWGVFYSFNDREFSYEETVVTRFGESASEGWSEIKFLFKEKEITDGGILNIKFKNTGGEAIYSSDFDKPIIITLDGKSQFLSAKIINPSPKHLAPIYNFENNKLTLEPALFNPGDEVTIQAVVNGQPKTSEILTRIGGIKDIIIIQPVEDKLLKYLSWPLLLYGVIAMMGLSVLTTALVNKDKDSTNIILTKTSGIILAAIIVAPASLSIGRFLEFQDIYPESWWGFLLIITIIMLVSDFISMPFKVKNKTSNN